MSMMLHERAKSAPRTAGVYIFRRGKTPVYIGKAADLKKRLASYFRANAAPKVTALREEADTLEWIELGSETEALIREAELIKRHLPKYNVLMRDDKSYFYAALTREEFPRIFVAHKTHLDATRHRGAIGPFTSGSALWSALKLLRRILPYCTCKEKHKRHCINGEIGKCPGFCCLRAEAAHEQKRLYRRNIRAIMAVLAGKRRRILSRLRRDMKAAARVHDFERAARLRDQADGLENIFSHEYVLERPRRRTRDWSKIESVIRGLIGNDTPISRVEGYDISNISGTEATGSMVVFINGYPSKSEYKKFKIKTVHQISDVDMHKEVMRRRLAHREWGMPDLILIDGGKPQINAIASVLRPGNKSIRLAALAKREEDLYIEGKALPIRLASLPRDTMLFFQHVRDESHRFAKKYHHKLREILYRTKNPKDTYINNSRTIVSNLLIQIKEEKERRLMVMRNEAMRKSVKSEKRAVRKKKRRYPMSGRSVFILAKTKKGS